MIRRILVMVTKELKVVLREPRMRLLLVGPPLLQLIIFGYAVNLDVEDCRIGWFDSDRSRESLRFRALFEGSPNFRIVAEPDSEEAMTDLLDRGAVLAVIRVPVGLSRDLLSGRPAQVQSLVDGTNSNTAGIVSAYIGQTVARFAAEEAVVSRRRAAVGVVAANEGAPGFPWAGIRLESRVWFNPNLRSQNYFIPGVIANIIGLVTVMLTAMAIVREKEVGTMEQLMVTPIRPLELMLGKTLPFALVGILEVALVTGAALLVFGIPMQGSPPLLLLSSVLFLLTTLGAGLFISTISGTQQQAMMGSFFFFLPAFMLSGFAFPIRNMPLPVQYLTYLNPMRYFIEIARGIFLKGTGLEVLWPQMIGLLVFGTAMITFSALRFHKRLD